MKFRDKVGNRDVNETTGREWYEHGSKRGRKFPDCKKCYRPKKRTKRRKEV